MHQPPQVLLYPASVGPILLSLDRQAHVVCDIWARTGDAARSAVRVPCGSGLGLDPTIQADQNRIYQDSLYDPLFPQVLDSLCDPGDRANSPAVFQHAKDFGAKIRFVELEIDVAGSGHDVVLDP